MSERLSLKKRAIAHQQICRAMWNPDGENHMAPIRSSRPKRANVSNCSRPTKYHVDTFFWDSGTLSRASDSGWSPRRGTLSTSTGGTHDDCYQPRTPRGSCKRPSPLPPTVVKLSTLLADPNYDIWDVVRAVELDPVLAGKVIRLANAPCYGGGSVASVRDAVTRIGTGSVRSLAIAANVQPKRDVDLSPFQLTPQSYWKHSVSVLSFAEQMMEKRLANFGNDFTTAALLHDFGKLILADYIKPEHVELLSVLDPAASPADRETTILGVSHAEVSAVVAQAWSLPNSLVQAVQHHHHPSRCGTTLCHGLNVANQLSWTLESRDDDLRRESSGRLESLNALGVEEAQLNELIQEGKSRLDQILEIYAI